MAVIFLAIGRNNSILVWFPLLLLINSLPNTCSFEWVHFFWPLATFELFIFWFSEVSYVVSRYRFLFIYPAWDFDHELLIFPRRNICGFSMRPKKEINRFKVIYLCSFFPRCLKVLVWWLKFIIWGVEPPKKDNFGLQICVWTCLSFQPLRNLVLYCSRKTNFLVVLWR